LHQLNIKQTLKTVKSIVQVAIIVSNGVLLCFACSMRPEMYSCRHYMIWQLGQYLH